MSTPAAQPGPNSEGKPGQTAGSGEGPKEPTAVVASPAPPNAAAAPNGQKDQPALQIGTPGANANLHGPFAGAQNPVPKTVHWWHPVFEDTELERAFQAEQFSYIEIRSVKVLPALGVISLAPLIIIGYRDSSWHGGWFWAYRICFLMAAGYLGMMYVCLKKSTIVFATWYDLSMAAYTVFVVAVYSFTADRTAEAFKAELAPTSLMEAYSLAMVCAELGMAATLLQISSFALFILVHVSLTLNLVVTLSLGSLEEKCMVDHAGVSDSLGFTHLRNVLFVYLIAMLLVAGRRSQEMEERRRFSKAYFTAKELSEANRRLASCEDGANPDRPDPKPTQEKKPTQVAPLKEQPDLTVLPPPVPLDTEDATRQMSIKEWRAPNPLLVKAMSGRRADAQRIRQMATSIRKPDYTLRMYYDDCMHSFPELSLFFDDRTSAKTNSMKAMASGLSGEAEYQRTIGALFTVYWMLRLDSDGRQGFCFGVDSEWRQIKPEPRPPVNGKAFFKMTTEEKRVAFYETMDWKPFVDLVNRAGCAAGSPGNIERIVALLCLTAFHDIMKIPMMQPIVQPEHAPYRSYEAGVRIHDHDLALSYVLQHFPNLLPSYAVLPEEQRRGVLFTQGKMQFNHGWFVQAEAPPGGMLSEFKSVLEAGAEQADIDLYFLHWLTDLAGAEATPLGGAEKLVLKFPHSVLASFLSSMPYLSRLKTMSETDLVEKYLEARWKVLVPDECVPSGPTSIAVMRLAIMAQAENAKTIVDAFRALDAADQQCLLTELSRTGCKGQTFRGHTVCGGPAFLIYYSPALLQRNNGSQEDLQIALHILCVVLRGARAVWSMNLEAQGNTVIIQIGELKSIDIQSIIKNPGGEHRSVWTLLCNNNHEGTVSLCKAGDLNALYMGGSKFRVLDFSMERHEECGSPAELPIVIQRPSADIPSTTTYRRILVFTDMSTECDDECALLWLLAALNRRRTPATVELVQTDTHARFQWMSHIFKDKMAPGGDWVLLECGTKFQAGRVRVNMYLAHSPSRENKVINDIRRKAPHVQLVLKKNTGEGGLEAVREGACIGGKHYDEVPAGRLDSIVVAAAIPDVKPEFFERFTYCKCAYVVGTPGGINCPMPSWKDLLAGLHKLCPVLYLTPQLTRTVRFPANYVRTNVYWNETIKHTVWESALSFMARRPEFQSSFGNWGLVLRLNVANATFCEDWYRDVMHKNVEDAERSEKMVRIVNNYVQRNSGDDRELGAIVDELRNLSVNVDAEAVVLNAGDNSPPADKCTMTYKEAKESIRKKYQQALFKAVFTCVTTTETLLFQSERNRKFGVDEAGFEKEGRRCGYKNPEQSLEEIFGAEDAIALLQELPLRRLTPAYDVVGMICGDTSLEDNTDIDGGLGLLIAEADDTMGLGILTDEQQKSSNHPILMTMPQPGDGVYAVGPFS